jgi:hypothetical protein
VTDAVSHVSPTGAISGQSFRLARYSESRGMKPRLSINRSYLAGDSAGLLPSVAQPPLPLQEFLPLQLLSPLLQPPLPLHEFFPLQECFSVFGFFISSEMPAFELV